MVKMELPHCWLSKLLTGESFNWFTHLAFKFILLLEVWKICLYHLQRHLIALPTYLHRAGESGWILNINAVLPTLELAPKAVDWTPELNSRVKHKFKTMLLGKMEDRIPKISFIFSIWDNFKHNLIDKQLCKYTALFYGT